MIGPHFHQLHSSFASRNKAARAATRLINRLGRDIESHSSSAQMLLREHRQVPALQDHVSESRISASMSSSHHEDGPSVSNGDLVHQEEVKRVVECGAVAVVEEQETIGKDDNDQQQEFEDSCHRDSDDIPCVVAIPLREAFVCLPSYYNANQNFANYRRHSCKPQSNNETTCHNGRPEFIYASTILSNTTANAASIGNDDVSVLDRLGLAMETLSQNGEQVVLISRLLDNCPFRDTNIQPGDVVLAVNGHGCAGTSLEHVQALFQKSLAVLSSSSSSSSRSKNIITISLCVHNPHGDATTVSSSILKPQPTTRIGITLSRHQDTMRIKHMASNNLFADTLLLTHQRCLAINDIPCECLSASSASAILSAPTTKRVTIVSKVQSSRPVTLAVLDQRRLTDSSSSTSGSSSSSRTHASWWQKVVPMRRGRVTS